MVVSRTLLRFSATLLTGVSFVAAQSTRGSCRQVSPLAQSIHARRAGRNPQAAITVQALQQFARQCLSEAQSTATSEPQYLYKTWAYEQIRSAWRPLNAGKARRLLEHAWQLSQHISNANDRALHQSDIVLLGWAGFDTKRAKELIPLIKDNYWRDFARDHFAQNVAQVDLEMGARLLRAIPAPMDRDREVTEAAYDIMREDPERAAQLALRVTNVDAEAIINAVLDNIPVTEPDCGRRLLRFLKSNQAKEKVRGYVVAHLATNSPEAAVQLALQIQATRPRLEALVAAATGIKAKNPEQAKDLLQRVASLLIKDVPEAKRRQWTINLAPKIALIDTEIAQRLLEGFQEAPHSAYEMLQLAGAWAFVDIHRAESWFQKAIETDKNVCFGPHGQSLNDDFTTFLAGLASVEPERAAGLLKEYAKSVRSSVSNGNPKDDQASEQNFLGQNILDLLLTRAPLQALTFAEAYASSQKRKAVEQQLLARKILSHPAQAEQFLPSLQNGSNYFYDHDSVARQVALKLAWKDGAAAERVVQMIEQPGERVEGCCNLARILFAKQDPHALLLLQQARKTARQDKTAFHRATDLASLAGTALYGIRFAR